MKALASFQNCYQNSSIVVCGCGESLNDLAQPEQFVTIGVNDVGRRFQPNYLIVVNPRSQFSGDRFRYVETSQAEYLFTQLDLGVRHPNIVKFGLGTFGGTDFSNPDVLHYTNNSPYIGLCLAILMGARRIGLIGVDFTDNHFFAATGKHPLAPQFDSINEQYCRLSNAAEALGVEIFNLSRISRLTAFPKISVDEFAAKNAPATGIVEIPSNENSAPLRIVSYATTPVAGVPAILARCINAETENSARCVWATNSYGNGVQFAGDVEWQREPQIAENLLAEADLIIVHNGKVAPAHEKIFKDKPVVTMAHNYLWNVDERFVKSGFAGVVVGQYQAALDEFKDWSVVPNPVPFWETEYQPEAKPSEITICYTPSGKHEKYPLNHQLYWHSKGYETTLRVLEKLVKTFPLRLEIIGDRQISHTESLAMKRRAHIVIDECVTGSYHRNSLEGLACGAVVVNGLGILPKVADVLRRCAFDSAEMPFVAATLENLEAVLTELIESGRENLVQKGAQGRRWLEENWNFRKQWQVFWLPAIAGSFQKAGRKFGFAAASLAATQTHKEVAVQGMKVVKKGVSIVVPHGGKNRLPHLRTCLANLRQCRDVGEIIVVEMDTAPRAAELARKWADKYVFLPQEDLFERARALNTGSAFAECEFVLWLDNDLLVPPDFVSRAAIELRQKNLDFLKPYWEVKYLSLADSEKVMQGVLDPNRCQAVNTYSSSLTDGGAGLVRREFLQKYGGIPAGFRGWGGEDNGWMHKVRLLGQSARTAYAEQKVFHLYHPLSGGYGGQTHIESNPHYYTNLALLDEIRRIGGGTEFLANFPPQTPRLWSDTRRIYFVSSDQTAETANETARELNAAFAAEAETVSFSELKTAAKDWTNEAPEALVFFDFEGALEFLNDEAFAPFTAKTLIVAGENRTLTPERITRLERVSGVLASDEKTAAGLKQANLKVRLWNGAPEGDFRALALLIAQPLSLILNGQTDSEKTGEQIVTRQNESADLPVWLYWEGDCPDWIKLCHKTILEHAPNAQILSPESFYELWTQDRDINLTELHVAQRADFIRAYLLKKYGGVWIDSDCVMLQSLGGLLERFGANDFAAHRERGGYFGNEFMIARQGSRIAAALYERICGTLRTTKNFGWCDLGCVALTDVISRTDAAFFEIECELIQPICWSEVAPYFVQADDAAHRQVFSRNALCYMLSNLTLQKYAVADPDKNLLAEDSFFSFLVRRSLSENGLKGSDETLNGNGARRGREIGFYLEMMAKLAPKKVLDLDVGLGRWAVLLRDLFESSTHKKDWKIKVEALVEAKNGHRKSLAAFYNRVSQGGLENLSEKQDLTILGDYFRRNPTRESAKVLEKTLEISDYVLLNLQAGGNGLGEYLTRHPDKIAAQDICEKSGQMSVLLSLRDPQNLRPPSDMKQIWDNAADRCRQSGMESLSGPGSSLAQTAEIRRRLPILFAFLDINSMTDAPCGDFNWLREVDLRLSSYCGIDVAPSVIEQNRQNFENAQRTFRALDITRDFLPPSDLILCRDCLVHLPFERIFAALRQFCQSGAKYLLTTHFSNTKVNTDIQTGDWRTLNFTQPPFNFGAPLYQINEHCTENGGKYADKSLGLWLISDIYRHVK
ncbi:MAG TPA: glycosyltransferase [Pyrinomonadaceae bacterium]|jgi:hypothetical protein